MDYIIIEKLKKLRKSKKITQEQLAEKLDISRSKVSSWETNRRDMSITEAIRLANIYEVSLDNLFEIKKITEEEYVKISDKFLKGTNEYYPTEFLKKLGVDINSEEFYKQSFKGFRALFEQFKELAKDYKY